ncbi:hypothetical protein [Streptomyces sp. NPDC056227]
MSAVELSRSRRLAGGDVYEVEQVAVTIEEGPIDARGAPEAWVQPFYVA